MPDNDRYEDEVVGQKEDHTDYRNEMTMFPDANKKVFGTPPPYQSDWRTKTAQAGLNNWEQNYRYTQDRVGKMGLGMEQGALDDWRKRFRDQYFEQMKGGLNRAAGDLRADAGLGGNNPALMRSAISAGGDLMARGTQDMSILRSQMNMADAMAQYEQSQRAATLNLAMGDLMSTMDQYKLEKASDAMEQWRKGDEDE